jgi:hypothetical protein
VSQSSEFCAITLPYECLLLFILLSTQFGNFWIHPRTCLGGKKVKVKVKVKVNVNVKVKVKLTLCFNCALHHEGVSEEWRYSSTHSGSRHWMEVSGQFQSQAALTPEKEPLASIG